jgi:hypothetical protein
MNDLKGTPPDEFQFKPLTKGLGFHPKKEASLSNSVSTPSASVGSFSSGSSGTTTSRTAPAPQTALAKLTLRNERNAQAQAAAMTAAAPGSRGLTSGTQAGRSLKLDTPLPRPEAKRNPQPSTSGQAVENILKNLNEKNKNLSFQDKGQNLSPFVQTAPSLAAGFLDLLLITALGLLYLMTLVFTLKVDLIKAVTEGGTLIWALTGGVFLVVGFVYYVTQRMFLGFTLGEWAYEQRLGLPDEMKNSGYSFKVFTRQLFIMATGIVVVPMLSWALGRDMAGLSGLCTYRKR